MLPGMVKEDMRQYVMITGLLSIKEKVEDYLADMYRTKVVQNCYNCVLPPIARDKFWLKTNFGAIDPSVAKKLSGRPKRKRLQEEGKANGNNLSRRGKKKRCQNCFKLDHNTITYPLKKNQCDTSGTYGSETVNQEPLSHGLTSDVRDESQQEQSGTLSQPTALSSTHPTSSILDQVTPPNANTPTCTTRGISKGRGRAR
ncbi:hypothetical protein PTKIN_Ptkin06aG0098400 [Pterospermum kingtungense]